MAKFRFLILTAHQRHSEHNSLYGIAKELSLHPGVKGVHIASIDIEENKPFFRTYKTSKVFTKKVDESFSYENTRGEECWKEQEKYLADFDFILLRLPPPPDKKFYKHLLSHFPKERIINNPEQILKVGSKSYLLKYPKFCPPVRLCKNVTQIRRFLESHDIVLKPLHEYGGKGVVRLDKNFAYKGEEQVETEVFLKELEENKTSFLAMKFLKDVSKGDKRIIICNGRILAAVLRLPKDGSWICNVAQGGSDADAYLTKEERVMAKTIAEDLIGKGIVLFALDTLEEDGKRYLSEINCTSVGGIVPAQLRYKKPIVKRLVSALLHYCKSNYS